MGKKIDKNKVRQKQKKGTKRTKKGKNETKKKTIENHQRKQKVTKKGEKML